MLADVHIGKVARWFRPAVYGVVFRCRNGEVVFRVIALQSGDVSNSHPACEERNFAVRLLSTTPARVAEDIEIGRPEIQATHNAGVSFSSVLHVLDASLNTNLRRHGVDARRVKGGGKADRFRIFGYTFIDHTMKGLAPPLVGRDLEPRNFRGVVLHLRSLLSKGHAAYQIRGPLRGRKLRIHVGEIRGILGNCRLLK